MDYSTEEVIAALSSPDKDIRLRGALAAYETPPVELQEPIKLCLENEDDVKVQATLLKSLAYIGLEESKEIILPYFGSPDNRVRANAVEALSLYQDEGMIPHFQKMLKDPHNRVKGNALIALSHFSEERFKRTLRRMTRSSLKDTCLTALYVLSRFEEPWAVSLLGQMGLRPDNPVPERTLKVLEVLSDRSVPGAYPALMAARRTTSSRILPSSITLLQPPKVTMKNVSRLLNHPETDVRIFAVQESAQRLPADVSIKLLAEKLPEERNSKVLATIVKWIGILASSGDLSLVVPYLEHSDPRVRANTLEGLYNCMSPAVFPHAMKMAKDTMPRVRAMAARIIARHDMMEAGKILKELVFGKREDEISAALHAVDVLDEDMVIELMEHAIINGGERIKTRVLSVLRRAESRMHLASQLCQRYARGSFSDYESVYIDEQITRLDSTDDLVRLDALERLRYCRSDRAWDIIEELAASDRAAKVREMAARFVAACQLERQNAIVYHSIGLRVLQLHNLAMVWNEELAGLCAKLVEVNERINEFSQALAHKESLLMATVPVESTDGEEWELERLFVERRDLLIVLGEAGRDAVGKGTLRDYELSSLVAQLKVAEEAQ